MANRIKTAALALAAPGLLLSAMPAQADPWDRGDGWHHRDHDDGYDRGGYDRGSYERGGYDRGGYDRGYNYRGGYRGGYDQPVYRDARTWRGNDGRYYCRRSDGTTGLVVGAAIGGVIGHEAAGRRGDRGLGTILGAGIGALIGRGIEKSSSDCR